ncbi:STAS domain-containing protein [Arthrobacter agilis]|uniref:STAS domain-containing protein n=1 Tax=Arthrobacter agilis TaxID=37921 RepID=UPI000B351A8F|nr:STAS domain-containing protein [Arthrobacter agilis]OUM42928.1 anti-anti-sigma factor [Arthrobacter agilis]PPB45873.1 anti-sigma factor antagonist [Arthrobacter agilis]TPV25416.1 STAS domain-containing protein [Arthrobacter agilis]WDF32787.1 STAS domain-containing protein [Arthrobacter agilis]VDR33153.1 Anti-anti-sigma-B factor [Arthrobacter agilis]
MEFTTQDKGLYTEVSANGRLNMVAAPKLREVIAGVVDAGGKRIVVNLTDTTFMDSSGLGALIGCLKLARQSGGDLRIAAVQPQVNMVLELTSMHRVLTPHSTPEEAFRND